MSQPLCPVCNEEINDHREARACLTLFSKCIRCVVMEAGKDGVTRETVDQIAAKAEELEPQA